MGDLTSTELLKINSSPFVIEYLDETNSYPYVVPGGVHTISIINNDSAEMAFTVTLKNGKVLSSSVPARTVYTGKFNDIESIDTGGINFNLELGGVI